MKNIKDLKEYISKKIEDEFKVPYKGFVYNHILARGLMKHPFYSFKEYLKNNSVQTYITHMDKYIRSFREKLLEFNIIYIVSRIN